MQYTGYSEYSENDPPTYACVGDRDGIASWNTMKNRLDRLAELGIDTEFHVYSGIGHGFGLGTGTEAEGWIQDAAAFWERQMEEPESAGRNENEDFADEGEEMREGTSKYTISTPDDFPAEYHYGTGRISDWSRQDMLRKMPELEGNVPAVTEFTENMRGYFDSWDFRPYVTAIPVRDGVTPKGAVILMAGGAYEFRGNYTDSLPTAAALREYGFQTFIVDYRLSPYTQEEGALDELPAHASADGMIYSFYGRLSVGNMDPEWLAEGELPPTFYVYGTEDPFYRQFERQYQVVRDMGIPVERIVLKGWPHGFGADGGWVEDYGKWLKKVFQSS